jgi:hypothetical protein
MNLNNIPVIISANYVTGDSITFYATQPAGQYNSMQELNEDMSRLITNIPSGQWRLQLAFQDKGQPL